MDAGWGVDGLCCVVAGEWGGWWGGIGMGWMVGRNRGVTKREGIGELRRGVKFEEIGREEG